MPFFRAEHLFEQKSALQRQTQGLLKAEKLHKNHVCAVFDLSKCSSDGRQAAKTSHPASISQFYFVKDSE